MRACPFRRPQHPSTPNSSDSFHACQRIAYFSYALTLRYQDSIKRAARKSDAVVLREPLLAEAYHHMALLQARVATFVGRDQVVHQLLDAITPMLGCEAPGATPLSSATSPTNEPKSQPPSTDASERLPVVVHGPSGSGKTALLARIADQYGRSPRVRVLVRFLGTSPASSTLRSLLESLCAQLAVVYAQPIEPAPSSLKVRASCMGRRLVYASISLQRRLCACLSLCRLQVYPASLLNENLLQTNDNFAVLFVSPLAEAKHTLTPRPSFAGSMHSCHSPPPKRRCCSSSTRSTSLHPSTARQACHGCVHRPRTLRCCAPH
jgi:hypothetical protein